jgi:hypothetical protein
MSDTWGRTDAAGRWLHPTPAWTVTTLLVAVLSAVAIGAYRYTTWTPLQRWYLSSYLRSQVMGGLGVAARGHYRLLQVADAHGGTRLALDDEVQLVSDPATAETTFALTEAAVRLGDRRLVWQDAAAPHATFHAFVGEWIYRDRTVTDLVKPAVWGGLGVVLIGLLIAIPADLARARERRQGRRLKGPELVTGAQFTHRYRADGIGFVQASRLGVQTPIVRVPRAIESSHFLIMGDTGTGKSALIRQVLQQLADRDEAAIVYDPALEYTPQFFTPERGDLILNPLDARCPYWNLGAELMREETATTIAAAFLPDTEYEREFFTDGPRRILAHLLKRKPQPRDILKWMAAPGNGEFL